MSPKHEKKKQRAHYLLLRHLSPEDCCAPLAPEPAAAPATGVTCCFAASTAAPAACPLPRAAAAAAAACWDSCPAFAPLSSMVPPMLFAGVVDASAALEKERRSLASPGCLLPNLLVCRATVARACVLLLLPLISRVCSRVCVVCVCVLCAFVCALVCC